jgi:hypothetical protein
MIIFGREIAAKVIAIAVGVLILVIAVSVALSQCSKRRSQAAQSRVEHSQADAASNSAADAINTVTSAGGREAASESLGRDNERDIRAAEGAGDKVKPAVGAAGRVALCRRAAYREDPECKGVIK